MPKQKFSEDYLEDTATALLLKINRTNIFPPLLKDPEEFISVKCKKKRKKQTPNAFIMCRMNVHKESERIGCKYNMRIISKATGKLWKDARSEEKNEYIKLSNKVKSYNEKLLLAVDNVEQNPNENEYTPYHIFSAHEAESDEALTINQSNLNFINFNEEEFLFTIQSFDLFDLNYNDFCN